MSVFILSKDAFQNKSKSLVALIATSAVLASSLIFQASPAHAAAGTVANGIVTKDLNTVGVTPTSLAQELAGAGVSVSNVSFTGGNSQAGTIDIADPQVVSFNHGIIMSSGDVSNAVGPNKSDSITGYIGGGEDPDLTALISNTATVNPMTYDATTLSFDFVPNTNKIYFTYTFASDEYLEWVNLFNDVFAFYVNGTNCATVPAAGGGGNVPVSIDTINSTVNSNLFRDNSFSNPPANPLNIEYDGLSVEMICAADVNPGVTNHMKLAIADTSDGILDTAVMIKAQSLSTTPAESCNNGIDDNNDGKIDMDDSICKATTTPAPLGQSGVGGNVTAPLPLPPVALTPIAYSGAPAFTGNEGTPILLDPSAFGWTLANGTVSSSWQVTGINGNTATCQISPSGAQAINPDGTAKLAYAVCPKDGEYVAHVWGWECGTANACGSSDDYDVDFFVHNAPPTSNITEPSTSGQATVTAGTPVTLAASVADPGDDPVTCTVTWGDGTTGPATYDPATQSCSAQNTYAAPASLGVGIAAVNKVIATLTATDSQGATSASAIVLNIGAASNGPGATPQTLSLNTALPDTASYGDVVPVDAVSDSGLAPAVSVTGGCSYDGVNITMTSSVDSCNVFIDQAGDSTYAAAAQLSFTILAAKAQILVVADPQTKVWGQPDPTLTYQIFAGQLYGTDSFTGSLSRAAGEDVTAAASSGYLIDQGTLSAGANYDISFIGEYLTITGSAPVLLQDAHSQTVVAGSQAVLSATSDASPAATVQWQVKVGANFVDIAGETNTTFMPATDAANDGAIYRALFTNGLGTVTSSEATISVVSVASVSPTSASSGQTIVISGTNLAGVQAIRFNGAQTTNFTVDSPTQISVVVPAKAKSGAITVIRGALMATSSDSLTVVKPAAVVPAAKVTNIWPRSAAPGSTVTITGTHLLGTTAVEFGGAVATNFVVVSSTRILATVPLGASTGVISLTNPNGNPNGNAASTVFTVRGGTMTPKVGAVRLVSATPGVSATLLLTGLNIGSATSIKLNGVELAFTAVKAEQVLIVVPIAGQNITPTINAVIVSNGVSKSLNTRKLKVVGWQ